MPIRISVVALDFDTEHAPFTKVFDQEKIQIGRDEQNDLVLDAPEVSFEHALLRVHDIPGKSIPDLSITDLGSTNGTTVESVFAEPGAEVAVQFQERIQIGNYLLKPLYVPLSTHKREEQIPASEAPVSMPETPTPSSQVAAPSSHAPALALATPALVEAETPSLSSKPPASALDTPALASETPEVKKNGTNRPSLQHLARLFRQRKDVPESSTEKTTEKTTETTADMTAPDQPKGFSLITEREPAEMKVERVRLVNFVAQRLYALQGKVTSNGQALEGVLIDGGPHGERVSDKKGQFSFGEIAEGTSYKLRFRLQGYVFHEETLSGVLQSDASLLAEATRVYCIKGRVEHNGQPIEGVKVSGGILGEKVTLSDGSFEFSQVPEGTKYSLKAEKEGFSFQLEQNGEGILAGDIHLIIQSERLITIRGQVTHNGKPLLGVEIDGGVLGTVITDKKGYYYFENVPEDGQYSFEARKTGYAIGTNSAEEPEKDENGTQVLDEEPLLVSDAQSS